MSINLNIMEWGKDSHLQVYYLEPQNQKGGKYDWIILSSIPIQAISYETYMNCGACRIGITKIS